MENKMNLMGIDIEAVLADANGDATDEQRKAAADTRAIVREIDAQMKALAVERKNA